MKKKTNSHRFNQIEHWKMRYNAKNCRVKLFLYRFSKVSLILFSSCFWKAIFKRGVQKCGTQFLE